MTASGPRSNRDPAAVERKRELLDEPHVRPLTGFVRRLRAQRGGGEAVPWFDPEEAGVEARIIVLLEAPGPRATGPGGPRPAAHGSGFVSPDNDDRSAATMWSLLREAGVDRRREIVTWNIVPWYVGDGMAIRAVTVGDLDEARPALLELLSLLPDLRVALLLGRKAGTGWRRARIDLPAIEAPHPSPQVVNIRPIARDEIRGALVEARRRAGAASGPAAHEPPRHRVSLAQFSDSPGVYALYRTPDDPIPLYVGVAATQGVRERWTGQHLRPHSGSSALRRTLGTHLGLVPLKLARPNRHYPPDVEAAITAFLREAWIAQHPTDSSSEARALESRLIAELNPVLNVARPRIAQTRHSEFGEAALREALVRLAEERPLFHSEADFQHALAWRLHVDHPAAGLRLETRPLPGRSVRLDLSLIVDDQRVAVELKYLTKRLALTVGGEPFELRDHAADDLGRYDTMKDVARLEELVDAIAATVGYALLLTNEPRYGTPGRSQHPADAAFRLSEGRVVEGLLRWGPSAGPATRRGRDDISLRGRYRPAWTDYSTVTSAPAGLFRYLLIQVTPLATPEQAGPRPVPSNP